MSPMLEFAILCAIIGAASYVWSRGLK